MTQQTPQPKQPTSPTKTSTILDEKLLKDPIVTENALKVLEERYLAKNDFGEIIETPKQMYMRVAEAVASAEEDDKARTYYAHMFYNIMASNEFMPNSPTLMNAGRRLGMLSACFVLPVEDDLDKIFDSVKATAMVQRAGGGTGYNFSNLRPNGSIVKSSGGTTAGPLSFIDVFSQATSTIQQGAFRRGANMGIMNIDHPDIIAFIQAKEDLTRWQNYNISVGMTDEFMSTLETQPRMQHRVYHKEWGTGGLYKKDGKVIAIKDYSTEGKTPDAPYEKWTVGDTWDLICKRAWSTGEPGLFFIDEANRFDPIAHLGRITSTNPCGEQPLHAWDSCNLGSINLSLMVDDQGFDWDQFRHVIQLGVRFLDNVVTVNNYPLPQIREMSSKTRRIGLGVMGFADLLFKLGIPYNSESATLLAESLSNFLKTEAEQESQHLGKIKGNYGAYIGSKHHKKDVPMRNSYVTTIAPTGTISIIANCSGGIEPIFGLSFKRTVMPDANGVFKEMYEDNPHWLKALSKLDPDKAKRYREAARAHGYLPDDIVRADSVGQELQSVFVTAHEIEPLEHVAMQAAWQTHIDSAVSKTINIPHDADIRVVSDAYWEAYWTKCKGITVYRDGCRDNVAGMKQPMSIEKPTELHTVESSGIVNPKPPESPSGSIPTDVFQSFRTQIKTQFGNLHVHTVLNEQGTAETEVFAQLGKAGDLIAADLEAICRLASMALKNGASIEKVIEQLEGIGTTHIMPSEHGKITSMPDALAKALKKYVKHKHSRENVSATGDTPVTKSGRDKTESSYGIKCPACSIGTLAFQEGCKKCHSCGFSAC